MRFWKLLRARVKLMGHLIRHPMHQAMRASWDRVLLKKITYWTTTRALGCATCHKIYFTDGPNSTELWDVFVGLSELADSNVRG